MIPCEKNFNDQSSLRRSLLAEWFFAASLKAEGAGKGLKIGVGDRDIEIDGKGKIVSAGTNAGSGWRWNILPR